MSIAPFPHTYIVHFREGKLAAPPRIDVPTGPPPQFGGSDRVWSPEELLLGAAVSCLESTFAAYAASAHLRVERFDATARAQLVKSEAGPVFPSIDITVSLQVAPEDATRAEQLLRTAEHRCIISRALSVPVHVSVELP